LFAIIGAAVGALGGFLIAYQRGRGYAAPVEGEPESKPGRSWGNILGTARIGAALGGFAGYMVFRVRTMGYKPSEAIVQITSEEQFANDVLNSDKPVLVEFYTQWCTVCHEMLPAINEIAEESKGRAVVAMVDAEALRAVAGKYEVNVYPIFVIIYKGEVVARYVGWQEKETLREALAKFE
jgi:thioredoxin 1